MKLTDELKKEYPFEPNYLSIDKIRLHYVDQGQGDPIVMLHGNPTWSFFYRNLAKQFSKNFRVVVPDHIGCGFSDKPLEYQYTLEQHIENQIRLIEKLELKNITLILHDWGGAIGMGVATRRPHLIKKIVVMNTAAFTSEEIPVRINILRNPFGEWFIRKFNGFAFPATFMATTKGLNPLVKQGFILPYHDFNSRIATAKFVRDIPMSKSHPTYSTLMTIEENLKKINVPLLILWGEKDFCFTTSFLKKWMDFFPNAKSVSYPNAGHYLIEDELESILLEIDQFLKA